MTAPDVDAVDRLLLDEAAAHLATATAIVVVDDLSGALAAELARLHPHLQVRVCCDALIDEQRVRAALDDLHFGDRVQVGADLSEVASGVDAALMRLPKSLAALDEMTGLIGAVAADGVRLFAGGRVKHMTRSMNDVLARHFTTVEAGLGRQKSRVLRAHGPKPAESGRWPEREHHDDLDLTVCAHGGVFAGARIDLGTRLLITCLDQIDTEAVDVIDLACGTGILACLTARKLPRAAVIALDASLAASRSAEATAAANGLENRVAVRRADGLLEVADASADHILCNPPFHRGSTKDSTPAQEMIMEAGRVLRPGGEMLTVFNAHLPYLAWLRDAVGATTILARDRHYLVTRSTADPAARR